VAVLAAAVCPHPPLLVPHVAAGAAPDLDALRGACLDVVEQLTGRAPDVVVIVGDAPSPVDADESAGGSLAGFGVDVRAGATAADGSASSTLPLALTIGAWLLDRAGWTGRRRYVGLPTSTSSADAAALGADLADTDEQIAVLVLGDGSARRSTTAPGYLDPRAADFDAGVVRALASANASALLSLDADLARELLAAGRASWQVLGGVIDATTVATGRPWTGEIVMDIAPYGVGYFVTTVGPVPAVC
jgi:hypothetical protein